MLWSSARPSSPAKHAYLEARNDYGLRRRGCLPVFRLRTRLFRIGCLSTLALAYCLTYHQLSRRGMREAPDYGIDGFLYVSTDDFIARRGLAMTIHYGFCVVFAPAHWVDRRLNGTPSPVQSLCCGLSG